MRDCAELAPNPDAPLWHRYKVWTNESIGSNVSWSVPGESSSIHRPVSNPRRLAADLAVQYSLGILSQRRNGSFADRHYRGSGNATTSPLNPFMPFPSYAVLVARARRDSSIGVGSEWFPHQQSDAFAGGSGADYPCGHGRRPHVHGQLMGLP